MPFPLNRRGFHHRHNSDGTWDSRCLLCYRTATRPVIEESLLGPFELTHQCGLVDLMHLTNPHWNGVSTARAE